MGYGADDQASFPGSSAQFSFLCRHSKGLRLLDRETCHFTSSTDIESAGCYVCLHSTLLLRVVFVKKRAHIEILY